MVRVVSSRTDEQNEYARLARESLVDVVLVTGLRTDDERPGTLALSGMPFVFADLAATAADEWDGTRQAVRHLAAIGHRRIAFVIDDSLVRSAHRAELLADESHALEVDAVVCRLPEPSPASAAAATERMLELPERPTAIVFETALLAAAAVHTASRGATVPGTLSVVALDDGPVALLTDPLLTTVRRDVQAWGRACGRLLIRQVGRHDPSTAALPPAELIVRGSTAPPPATLEHERSP